MAHEVSPTARALVALEVIQGNPGITAQQLGARLGVSDRAALAELAQREGAVGEAARRASGPAP